MNCWLSQRIQRQPEGHRAPTITCADGFRLSVQASAFCYCTPRQDIGPWTEVECGAVSQHVPALDRYSDGGPWPETVYGYVPVSIVKELIAAHGGIPGIKESTVTDTTTTTPNTTTEQESEQRTRRRRVASVEIPDEIHALCTLTGQDPVAVIESIVAAKVADIRTAAKASLVVR